MPETTTIPNVELVRAGTWAASTGVTVIGTEDLEAMLAAAQDGEVDAAAVRIGHVDPRFDGEPALGWVGNLRLSDDGKALIGDLIEVPTKLAEVIPRAFRRRSVEIAWGVRTPKGKRYKAALSGLALLGVTPPAVKGLADVLALFAEDASRSSSSSVSVVATNAGDEHAGELTADRVSAFAVGDDPADQAAADVELALERLAAATHTPPEAIAAVRSAMQGLLEATPPPGTPDNPTTSPPQEDEMAVTEDRIRELLELEDGADVEAALVDLRTRAQDGTESGGDEDETETPAPTTTPAEGDEDEEPAEEARTPELVTLSAGQYAELRTRAEQGAEAFATIRAQEREQTLRSALSEGRIAPPDVEAWRGRLEADFEGTRSLLGTLTPAFPTTELGSDADTVNPAADAAWDAFEQSLGFAAPQEA